MVIDAIKDNGDKKISNIENKQDIEKVWRDLTEFCLSKKSSHFAIEEKPESYDCIASREFSELIYHRLLHLRKTHVSSKGHENENKLSIYAINYAATYSLHARDRLMEFVVDYKLIHDRVRRYIYDPSIILKKIKIENGIQFPCVNCGALINPGIMKAAWEMNTCPYCGNHIYLNEKDTN